MRGPALLVVLIGCAGSMPPVDPAGPARVFHVDDLNGRDEASGLSPAEAWRTLGHVSAYSFMPGDRVLFRRGGVWRGQLRAASGSPGRPVVYAAYGKGARPLLLGSVERSRDADWREVAVGVWATGALDLDVGNVVLFARDGALRFGLKRWTSAEVNTPLSFAHDSANRTVRIRHDANPAAAYARIELALTRDVVQFSQRHDVVFEGLAVRYGGAHGFAGTDSARIVIRDCEISYVGGGKLYAETLRYGNGVEFWGNAEDALVERNEIFQIYDTGVTNQNDGTPATQRRITYRENSIADCGMASFEVWNRPGASRLEEIRFERNTCVRAGGGWGGDLAQRGRHVGGHVAFFTNLAATDRVVVRENVFSEAASWLVFADAKTPWWRTPGALAMDDNCWHSSAPERAAFLLVGEEGIAYRDHRRFVNRLGSNDAGSRYADPMLDSDLRVGAGSPCAGMGRRAR